MKFPKHFTAALVGIALTSLALSGCANRDATPAEPGAATPTATETAAPPKESGIIEIITQPGTETGFVGALKDVTVKDCVASESGAKFSGTVTNPEATPQSYRIYVSVLNGKETLAIKEIDTNNVKPSETVEWSGSVATTVNGATCVLRVERTADQ